MNKIHDTVIIEGDVEIGENNTILPYSYLKGPLKIGDNNWIGPNVVIGTPGEDTKKPHYDSSKMLIKIGSNNIIREHVAIQKPCYEDLTVIGNNVFLMHGVHVPHDAVLNDNVTIAPNAVVGGITKILRGANIGMGAALHQYSIIGHYSIVATNSAAVKNVKPFSRFIPGKSLSVNTYAIKKFGFEDFLDEITNYVLKDKNPESYEIKSIVDEFYKLHEESGRTLY